MPTEEHIQEGAIDVDTITYTGRLIDANTKTYKKIQ